MSLDRQRKFEETLKGHIKRAGLTQAAVARKLGYRTDTLNKWIKGLNRIPDAELQKITEFLLLSGEEQQELFHLAGYIAVSSLLADQTRAKDGPAEMKRGSLTSAKNPSNRLLSVNYLSAGFFIGAFNELGNRAFQWSDAPAEVRASWPGLLLYSLRSVSNRITPRGFLRFTVALFVGAITIFLAAPVLRWPIEEIEARWQAFASYSLATWLVPLLVALLIPYSQPAAIPVQTISQRVNLLVVKFIGALVGFWVFSILGIGCALIWYYCFLPPLPPQIRALLALVPLLFSYAAAQRIPVDRHQMFAGKVRMHPADWLFLGVIGLAGPLSSLFLYTFYGLFTDRLSGPLSIILALIMIAGWEYRRSRSRTRF
ncbi:MAG TPA: helix-turn-helix transcriptional regulator [Anaerolineae bacterium]|nr:helix-turn-helix transcriptional regulator [Anaerolineae bacterium]